MEALKIAQVAGTALPLRGEDVDTDRIMPARFLRAVRFEGLERHVFEDDRAAATRAGLLHPFDDPRFQGASVLLVNNNFGCGSSREHAPQALQRWGIRIVIGESFSEIFFGNAVVIGLPCVTAAPEDMAALIAAVERDPGSKIRVDIAAGTCESDAVTCPVSIPPHVREAFVAGTWDTTALLMERYEEVDETSARLPYIDGFTN